MSRTTDSRQRMIRSAAMLMRRQGFAATGWRQVVAVSGAPWGSQAHHFPGGKLQLATEALAVSAEAFDRGLASLLAGLHPADAVRAWSAAAARGLESSGWSDGCPVATVALETAHDNDQLAAACSAALGGWRATLTRALSEHGATAQEAPRLAALVLAGLEGALLLARADRAAEPLLTVGEELASVVRARLP